MKRVRLLALCAVGLAIGALAATPAWVSITPEGKGFTATFPRKPELRSERIPSARGEWESTSWTVDDLQAQSSFMVTVKDYSRADISGVPIDGVLENSCRGLDPEAHLTKLEGSPYPSRRCFLERGVGGTELLVIWVQPRLYVVSQICGKPCDRANRRRFLDGFRLEQVGQPPTRPSGN